MVQRLITKIQRKERMPREWSRPIVCPIYKKSEPTECKNYSGISLVNTAYKVIDHIFIAKNNS